MQTHWSPVDLKLGKKSRAHWAVNPDGRVAFFVHGFGGSAVGTWAQFPSLLQAEPKCAGCDLIFYGYDGLRTRSRISALDLLQFLDAFLCKPATIINPTLDWTSQRPRTFSYSKAVIVAHSLGAVVSRTALLEAGTNAPAGSPRRAWLDKTRLVLFAPAHLGADLIGLASSFLSAILLPLPPVLRFRFQVLLDLEPGSQTLQQLLADTHAVLANGNSPEHVASKVVLGGKDTVVSPNRFALDPTPTVFQGKSHTKVCKPDPNFLEPISEVASAL